MLGRINLQIQGGKSMYIDKVVGSSKLMMVGAVVALGGLVVACGDEVEPMEQGNVSLSWEVSPKGCEDSGVKEVEVTLENSYYDYRERFLCGKGQAELGGVYPGNYRLNVSGFDK